MGLTINYPGDNKKILLEDHRVWENQLKEAFQMNHFWFHILQFQLLQAIEILKVRLISVNQDTFNQYFKTRLHVKYNNQTEIHIIVRSQILRIHQSQLI